VQVLLTSVLRRFTVPTTRRSFSRSFPISPPFTPCPHLFEERPFGVFFEARFSFLLLDQLTNLPPFFVTFFSFVFALVFNHPFSVSRVRCHLSLLLFVRRRSPLPLPISYLDSFACALFFSDGAPFSLCFSVRIPILSPSSCPQPFYFFHLLWFWSTECCPFPTLVVFFLPKPRHSPRTLGFRCACGARALGFPQGCFRWPFFLFWGGWGRWHPFFAPPLFFQFFPGFFFLFVWRHFSGIFFFIQAFFCLTPRSHFSFLKLSGFSFPAWFYSAVPMTLCWSLPSPPRPRAPFFVLSPTPSHFHFFRKGVLAVVSQALFLPFFFTPSPLGWPHFPSSDPFWYPHFVLATGGFFFLVLHRPGAFPCLIRSPVSGLGLLFFFPYVLCCVFAFLPLFIPAGRMSRFPQSFSRLRPRFGRFSPSAFYGSTFCIFRLFLADFFLFFFLTVAGGLSSSLVFGFPFFLNFFRVFPV